MIDLTELDALPARWAELTDAILGGLDDAVAAQLVALDVLAELDINVTVPEVPDPSLPPAPEVPDAPATPKVIVPDVVGRPIDKARAQLNNVGLDPAVVRRHHRARRDDVYHQRPRAGRKVLRRSIVTLSVSLGPRPRRPDPPRRSRKAKLRAEFIDYLKSQGAAEYEWGGESPGTGFDCSGIIYWAMGKLGFTDVPRVSADQIDYCKGIGVERAIETRAALLYVPGHIAVSLGNGKTFEARSEHLANEVGVFKATGRSWTRGGLLPELF